MRLPTDRTLLTSDKLPFMVMLFGFPAGILLLVASVLGFGTYETFRALGRGAPDMAITCSTTYPPVCAEESRRDKAIQRAGIAALLVGLAGMLWQTGFRYRYVWLTDDGDVLVAWGARLPVTLRRYPAAELSAFAATKELRFTVSPIVGTSVTRVGRAPDRWRLIARHRENRANLGSFVTEEEAKRAIELISSH